jgi:hypothetical protein
LEHYGTVKKLGNWDGRPDSLVAKHGQGKRGPDYFRGALELLHATYIGYHGYAHEWLADNPELTGQLLNRCGYWYFLQRVRLPANLRPGSESDVEFVWENRGVAPAYHPYRLQLRLEGGETVDQDFDAGNQRWLPEVKEGFRERYRWKLPGGLKAGAYTLKFKLHSSQAGRDVLVALKSELCDQAGFYCVGIVEIRE